MKKLCSILLCVTMIFSLFAICVIADDLPYTITGSYTGNATWDAGSKTLTLTNFNTSKGTINIDGDIIIKLVGDNTITSLSMGITSNGDVTFVGDGNLTLTAGAGSSAIQIEGGSRTLNFNGTGNITVTTSDVEAIKVDGTINFNSGTIKVTTSANRAAVIAYGVTKTDSLHKVVIDDDFGDYGITLGTKMLCTDLSETTSYASVDVYGKSGDQYVAKDEYYTGSTITDKYGNVWTKHYDSYTDSYVLDMYDKYGQLVESYPADNATGASWSYLLTYKITTFAVDGTQVTYDAQMITYNGAANSILIKAEEEPSTDEKITSNTYSLVNDPYVIDAVTYGTTAGQLKNNLTNDNSKLVVCDQSGTPVADTALVGTKYTVKLYVSGNLCDTRTIVVLGDAYADAKIDARDYQMIKLHIMGTNKITDSVVKLAADAYRTIPGINAQDYQKIKQIIMSR